MDSVLDLWLPILVSAVFVFVVSSVLHMLIPIHAGDYVRLPNEEALLAALREHGVGPGAYVFPRPSSMKEMSSPEMIARYQRGPVGWLRVIPSGAPAMGKYLVQWFLLTVFVSTLAAYIAAATLAPGAEYLTVFRVVGTAAVLGYCIGTLSESIWKSQPWTIALKFLFDGILYALVTAGTFAWLWPGAQ